MYRRRKRLRLEAQQTWIEISEEAAPLPQNINWHGSGSSSIVTAQTLTEEEEDELVKKAGPTFILDDGARFTSDPEYQSSESTLVSEPRASRVRNGNGMRCDCGQEPRLFWDNSHEEEQGIGRAR